MFCKQCRLLQVFAFTKLAFCLKFSLACWKVFKCTHVRCILSYGFRCHIPKLKTFSDRYLVLPAWSESRWLLVFLFLVLWLFCLWLQMSLLFRPSRDKNSQLWRWKLRIRHLALSVLMHWITFLSTLNSRIWLVRCRSRFYGNSAHGSDGCTLWNFGIIMGRVSSVRTLKPKFKLCHSSIRQM